MSLSRYSVRSSTTDLATSFPLDSHWADAEVGVVDHFHPQSASHHPRTLFRILADPAALYVRFDVSDRFVRCRHLHAQDMVCQDSCVEFFVQPAQCGYLNFEFSAIGTLLCYHITDPLRHDGRFAASRPLLADELAQVSIQTSLNGPIDPEIAAAVNWWLAARIPYSLLAIAAGRPPEPADLWRANLYKCAEDISHPHWASWSDVGQKLDFHQPQRFGELAF